MLRKCNCCGLEANTEEDLELFVKKKAGKHGRENMCYTCKNKQRREIKVKAILYKGNQCSACGIKYDGTNAPIFDFHHLNPAEKDFSLGNTSTIRWEKAIEELDKCILLCSNCHRLEHSNGFY